MDVKIQEKKSFFPFCMFFFLDDDPILCSVFSKKNIHKGSFHSKTPQLLKEYLMHLQLGTLDYGVQHLCNY